MLIVSRRKGQRIVIGDIEVVVTEITRSGVKLGIQAPPQQTILRGEVHEAIERANQEALATHLDADAVVSTPPSQGAPDARPVQDGPKTAMLLKGRKPRPEAPPTAPAASAPEAPAE